MSRYWYLGTNLLIDSKWVLTIRWQSLLCILLSTVRPRFVPPRKVPTSQECHFETRPKILAICYFPQTVPFFHEKETKNFKLIPFMNPCHFWNLQIHSCKIGTKLLLLCHCLKFFFAQKFGLNLKYWCYIFENYASDQIDSCKVDMKHVLFNYSFMERVLC